MTTYKAIVVYPMYVEFESELNLNDDPQELEEMALDNADKLWDSTTIEPVVHELKECKQGKYYENEK